MAILKTPDVYLASKPKDRYASTLMRRELPSVRYQLESTKVHEGKVTKK